MDIRYPAILKPEENGFLVEFIDLPDTLADLAPGAGDLLAFGQAT